MRIVIVEDEVQTREGLSRLIERIDPRYRVVGSAANGQKGLELICNKRPDVVITDIRMPQMDGLEMIESLARLNVTPKYIVISAFSEFSYARRAMSFGVSEYLLKPISMMELKQAMEKLELQLQSERMHTNEANAGADHRSNGVGDGWNQFGSSDKNRRKVPSVTNGTDGARLVLSRSSI